MSDPMTEAETASQDDGEESGLTVPGEFTDWPFDARRFVLAEANDTVSLREEVDALVGLGSDGWDAKNPGTFTKDQLAAVVMALGGPQ